MSVKNNKEEAKRWYEAAEDDLDSCGILLVHKKYVHACFFAHQAAKKALQAVYTYHSVRHGQNSLPDLLAGLRPLHLETFQKLEKFIPIVEKLEKYGNPVEAWGTAAGKEEIDACVNAAYDILSAVRTIVSQEDPS